MIRRLLVPLLALIIGAGLAWALLREPGYVLLQYGAWSAESTLPGLAAVLMLTMLPLWLGLRLLRRTLMLPAQLRARRITREQQRLDAEFGSGLRALAAGRWAEAERWLGSRLDATRHADLRCIGAALAAAQQHDADARQRLERWRGTAAELDSEASTLAWLDLRTTDDPARLWAAVETLLADRADPVSAFDAALMRAERVGDWGLLRKLLDRALQAGGIDTATRWDRPRSLLTQKLAQLEAGHDDPALFALLMDRAPELDSAVLVRLARLRLQRGVAAGLAEWIESVWEPALWAVPTPAAGPQRHADHLCALLRIYAELSEPGREHRLSRLDLRLAQAASLAASQAETQAAIAELSIQLERWNRARLALDNAQAASDAAWVWSMRARCHEASGRNDEAGRCWKQAAEAALQGRPTP